MIPTTYTPGQRPDLSSYLLHASVDWIDVRFTVPTLRQARPLQKSLGASWVRKVDIDLDPDAPFNPAGREFVARLQNPPSARSVKARLWLIDATPIDVTAVEFSLDFLPCSMPDRQEIAALLTHLFVGHQYPASSPRFGAGRNFGGSVDSPMEMMSHFQAGSTCYMSARGKEPLRLQRAYLKQTDDGVALFDWQVRGRFENVYRDPEVICDMLDGGWPSELSKDFTFRRFKKPASPLEYAINARTLQAGTRARRPDRRLFDSRTCADIELNRRTHDALRCLRKRWYASA